MALCRSRTSLTAANAKPQTLSVRNREFASGLKLQGDNQSGYVGRDHPKLVVDNSAAI
jgi:hypothetical protein